MRGKKREKMLFSLKIEFFMKKEKKEKKSRKLRSRQFFHIFLHYFAYNIDLKKVYLDKFFLII